MTGVGTRSVARDSLRVAARASVACGGRVLVDSLSQRSRLLVLCVALPIACGDDSSADAQVGDDSGAVDARMDGGANLDAGADAPVAYACPDLPAGTGDPCDPDAIVYCYYGEDLCCGRAFPSTTCFCQPAGYFTCWDESFCGTCLDPVSCGRADGLPDCYYYESKGDCLAAGGACIWYPPEMEPPNGRCSWATCGDLSHADCTAGDACLWVTLLEVCYPKLDAPLDCGPVE